MLTVHNLSWQSIIPYPVVTNPPPPHRVRDVAGRIFFGGEGPADPNGFFPVYTSEDYSIPEDKPNGVHLGFDFSTVPGTVFVSKMHYRVAPGQDLGDPKLQPIVLAQYPFDAGPTSDISIDLHFDAALGKAFYTPTLDAFPRGIAPGQTMTFDSGRGVPGEKVRLFTRTISGLPNENLLAAGEYDVNGEWTHQLVNPGGPDLRPGNKVVLVAFTKDASGTVIELNEVEVTIV